MCKSNGLFGCDSVVVWMTVIGCWPVNSNEKDGCGIRGCGYLVNDNDNENERSRANERCSHAVHIHASVLQCTYFQARLHAYSHIMYVCSTTTQNRLHPIITLSITLNFPYTKVKKGTTHALLFCTYLQHFKYALLTY